MLVSQKVLPRTPQLIGRWAMTPMAMVCLATAVLVIATLFGPGPPLGDWLGDTDDAVRLVTVRELLGGAPWFDTTLPRIGAPEALVSHWSRLIDAPLALMIALLTPLLGQDGAELATRIVWPTLLFAALALVVAREAHRRAGSIAAAFALFLVVTAAIALAQFKPGRIDHHNAQILCGVAGLIFLARSIDDRRNGWIAGALIGTGLAIGYEAIALTVPALAFAGLIAIWNPQRSAGPVRAVAGAALVLFLALALTIPPLRWVEVHCDALSLNLPLFAAYAAGGLWAGCIAGPRLLVRLAVVTIAVACGGLLYAGLEPACLAGPFGEIDPALGPLWLDHVLETSSLLWLAGKHPDAALAMAAFLCAGAAAQVALWRRHPDVRTGLMAAFVVLAVLLGVWQVKLLPYATWLAALPIAVWAAGLPATRSLSAPVVRIGVVVLLSQSTLNAGFDAMLSPFRRQAEPIAAAAASVDAADPHRPCYLSHNVRRLAALPPGLVAADIDLGPYIVALSPHRVVAAPYHRLAKGILANHAILTAPPDRALPRLRALGVHYVALCADLAGNVRTPSRTVTASLQTQLLSGTNIGGLEEIPFPVGAPIRVWRVNSAP